MGAFLGEVLGDFFGIFGGIFWNILGNFGCDFRTIYKQNYLEFECTTQLQQIWSGEEASSEDVVAISAITSLSQHHRRGRS